MSSSTPAERDRTPVLAAWASRSVHDGTALSAALARVWTHAAQRYGHPAVALAARAAAARTAQSHPNASGIRVLGDGFAREGLQGAIAANDASSTALATSLLATFVDSLGNYGGRALTEQLVAHLASDDAPTPAAAERVPSGAVDALGCIARHLADGGALEITLPRVLAAIDAVVPLAGATLCVRSTNACVLIAVRAEQQTATGARVDRAARDALALLVPEAATETASQLTARLSASTGEHGATVTVPLCVGSALVGAMALTLDREPSLDEVAFVHAACAQLTSAVVRFEASEIQHAEPTLRSQGELLAVVSHDLRNPLSAILMSVALLSRSRRTAPSRPDEQKQIAVIKRAADRMNQLIQNLVDAAHLESEGLHVEPRAQSLVPLIEDSVRLLESQANNKGIRLETDMPEHDCQLMVDHDRIVQSLSNIITTSLRFAPRGGAVTIRARTDANEATFTVAGSGGSLAPEDVAQLFDRRWWAEHNASLSTGLGLAVAKGIVEAHRGKMWVEATAVGLSICFTLPVATTEGATSSAATAVST